MKLTEDFSEGDHPRASDGKFGSGGGSSGASDKSKGDAKAAGNEAKAAKADSHAKKILSATVKAPAAIAKKAKALTAKVMSKVESRYGKKVATAAKIGMLLALPVPVPGMSLLTVGVIAAVAEIHHQITAKEALDNDDGKDVDEKELKKIIRDALEELFGGTLPKGVDPDAMFKEDTDTKESDRSSMRLKETGNWQGTTVEDGVLKNVKVLGAISRNGNLYPQKTREKAHSFLEGIHVNLNHLSKKGEDHTVEKRIGKLVNMHEKEDGTYADFHFLTSHPFAPALMEAATRMPDVYGFSINGTGSGKKKGGKFVVESIDTLRSVDLVADAGTTKSLFESETMDEAETKSCEQLLGELIAALVAEDKEELVKDVIKLKKKLTGDKDEEEGAAEEEAPEAPAEETPAEESWKREYKALKLEKDCRALIESANLQVEVPLLETLTALPNAEAREKFIRWHKQKSIVKQTKSSDVIKLTESQQDFAKLLRGK